MKPGEPLIKGKDALAAAYADEICYRNSYKSDLIWNLVYNAFIEGYSYVETYENKNSKWISVNNRMPDETKYESDNMQGHHEWTESERVAVMDDRGIIMIDSTRDGKFRKDGLKDCDNFPHYIEYWMPLPKFNKI